MNRIMLAVSVVGLTTLLSAQTGPTITLTAKPSPLGLGQNSFEAVVKDAKGQPVADAEVTLVLLMAADPQTKHPEMRVEGKLNNAGAGKYNGVAMVTMAGDWEVTAVARQHGKEIARRTERMMAVVNRPTEARAAKTAPAAQHGTHTHTHADAAKLKNPLAATTESVSSGAAIFAKQCASCHGATGKGDGAMAAKLKSRPADLSDAEWKHGPSDGEIFTLIRDGAKNAGMKAFRGALTDRQMWDLVNYIRSVGPGGQAR
jgi:mono/diheme cytochrome c family protein